MALGLFMIPTGLALFMRWRWSPELYLVLAVFLLLASPLAVLSSGLLSWRMAVMFGGAVLALLGYPVVRRSIRGTARPQA